MQVLLVLFCSLGVDEDIVDKDHYKLIQVLHKDLVHEVHEICMSIGKSERHYGVFV